ncbi:MAG: fpvA 2 [Verrucomicrobia bacterium]|nr:fpvA 2 [Verrucomicrobiota bacterium]
MKLKFCVTALALAAVLGLNARAQSARGSGDKPADEPLMLTPFEVSSSNDRGYLAGSSISATRINTEIGNLPFSITAITPQFIADTGAQNLMDIATQAAGVKNGTGSGNSGTSVLSIRGFLQSPQRNGFASNPLTSMYVDASIIDRVEIVKGPASLLYGAISPGGTVNYITRTAESRPFTELRLGLGSYNSESATVDVNQPLVPGKLLFRTIATYKTSEEYSQYTKGSTTVIAPTVKWLITPRISLTLDYQWLYRKDAPPATYVPNSDVATPASIVAAFYNVGYPGGNALLAGKTGASASLGFNDASDPGFLQSYPGVPDNFNTSDINDQMINDLNSINLTLDAKLNDHWSARVHYGADADRFTFIHTGHTLFTIPPPDSLVYTGGRWSVAPSWTAMTTAQQLAKGLAFAQAATNDPSILLGTMQNGTPTPVTMVRDQRFEELWLYATTLQAEAVGQYDFRSFKLQVLGGVFYDSVSYNARTEQNAGNAATPFFRTWDVNPASPTYYVNANEGSFNRSNLPPAASNTTTYNSDKAAYLLLNGTFFDNRLYVVAGARYNVSDSHLTNHVTGTNSTPVKSSYTTPQVGVGYKILRDVLLYASYSESYSLPSSPTLSVAGVVNGVPTSIPTGTSVPTIGKGIEVGVKADLIANTLNATVSAYQIDQENVLQTLNQNFNGVGVGTVTQGAAVRGKGIEAAMNWSPVSNLFIVANISEEDVRNTKEPVGLEYYLDQTPAFAAKTMGNLWARYNFQNASMKGMWIGGGANYVGESAGDKRNKDYFVPAYTIYNAAFGYDWKWNKANFSAVLNFKNLDDTFYKATPNALNQPRRILLTLTTRF